MGYLNFGTPELIPKKNCLKFLILHLPFCRFPIKIQIAILSTLESAALDKNIRCASKRFILTQRTQNIALVKLKCVSYLGKPIPLLLKFITPEIELKRFESPVFYFCFVLFCFVFPPTEISLSFQLQHCLTLNTMLRHVCFRSGIKCSNYCNILHTDIATMNGYAADRHLAISYCRNGWNILQ